MPYLDRTGPFGLGPGTGRRLGPCCTPAKMGNFFDDLFASAATSLHSLAAGGALAIGGGILTGAGSLMGRRLGIGFRLIGIAGMGVGAYLIYKALSGGEQGPPKPPTPEESGAIQAHTVVGTLYHRAMVAINAYRTTGELGWYQLSDLREWAEATKKTDISTWYDRILGTGSEGWTDLSEYEEALEILEEYGVEV